MKSNFIKTFIVLLLSVLLSNSTNANYIDQETIVARVMNDNKEARPDELKTIYSCFKQLVATKGSYEDVNAGWVFFNDNNDKLLIGSSGAVYCGDTMKSELLTKYGYDVVGFGGIFDEELIEILRSINFKKYKTIVFFGGVNDLNIRSLFGFADIDMHYYKTLEMMFKEAREHLIDNSKNVYYIKIKPLVLGQDYYDTQFVNCYNSMAKQVNDNVVLFGFNTYEIPFDTTLEYTAHYIHYNNKVVFETLFNSIS